MAFGPGKYDAVAQLAWAQIPEARCVVLAVIGHGPGENGFSVASNDPDVEKKLPQLLRFMANALEAEHIREGN